LISKPETGIASARAGVRIEELWSISAGSRYLPGWRYNHWT